MTRLRPDITAAAVVAGIMVAAHTAPPLPAHHVAGPAVELSATTGLLVDPADSGAAPAPSLADLADFLTTLATISTAAGVALAGLAATPFSLLSVAVTSLGTAISDLGGVFAPIGTAVADASWLPAGIAELITAIGTTLTQGIVTPIYDFLIKLVSPESAPAPAPAAALSVAAPDPGALRALLSDGGLPDVPDSPGTGQALDPGVLPDLSDPGPFSLDLPDVY